MGKSSQQVVELTPQAMFQYQTNSERHREVYENFNSFAGEKDKLFHRKCMDTNIRFHSCYTEYAMQLLSSDIQFFIGNDQSLNFREGDLFGCVRKLPLIGRLHHERNPEYKETLNM